MDFPNEGGNHRKFEQGDNYKKKEGSAPRKEGVFEGTMSRDFCVPFLAYIFSRPQRDMPRKDCEFII